jgi:hypothetical protein
VPWRWAIRRPYSKERERERGREERERVQGGAIEPFFSLCFDSAVAVLVILTANHEQF